MTWTYKGFEIPLNIKEIPDARPAELVNFLLQQEIEKDINSIITTELNAEYVPVDDEQIYFPQDMIKEIERIREENKELKKDKVFLLAENRRLREANILRAIVKRRR